MFPSNSPNLNILWSQLIVEELIRCGVEYFCIAPGSRSAPLAIATAQNPRAQSIVHFDERGLGFYALGLCAATKKPTVLITTSGTAVANLFPSIIEASKKKLPLIILTADRPPELRFTGANQTIEQTKIFGEYVRFFFDLPCPTLDIAPAMILTTIDQAVFRAKGELSGPVHLNCMYREPLTSQKTDEDLQSYVATLGKWLTASSPYTQYLKTEGTMDSKAAKILGQQLSSYKNGLIVVGKLGGTSDEQAVLSLADQLGWPIFADITSGLASGYTSNKIIRHFDLLLKTNSLQDHSKIDAVLHLGGRLTSARWLQFVKEQQSIPYIMVLKHPLRNDPQHLVTTRIQASITNFAQSVLPYLPKKHLTALSKYLHQLDQKCVKVINQSLLASQPFSEPALAILLSKLLPRNSGLFIGNSMPIRDLDMFAQKMKRNITITANRGASGIDGNIATAAGFSQALNKPCTALMGDLAALHDLNSLALLKQEGRQPFVLVIVNNNGGGIFSFLPLAQEHENYEKLFGTPHNLQFKNASAMFGLDYASVKETKAFTQVYQKAIKRNKATLIEVISDRSTNLQIHKSIQSKILISVSR